MQIHDSVKSEETSSKYRIVFIEQFRSKYSISVLMIWGSFISARLFYAMVIWDLKRTSAVILKSVTKRYDFEHKER
jgi:hypothetical protein